MNENFKGGNTPYQHNSLTQGTLEVSLFFGGLIRGRSDLYES